MFEEWRDIVGYEGYYQVSNLGNIKSLPRKIYNGKSYYKRGEVILKPFINTKGYYSVDFRVDGSRKTMLLHRVVAEAFLENNNNLPQINHKDGNKDNNSVENLEWITNLENMRHSWANGLHKPRYNKNNGKCKISTDMVKSIRRLRNKDGRTLKYIANLYNVGLTTVSDISNYKRRLHV